MSAPPSFAELGLSELLCETLEAIGYAEPSPVQARTIPLLLEGRDVFGQAQTGTGKTGAFALPLIDRLDSEHAPNAPQVLVLAPTRELAIQVSEAFKGYAAGHRGFRVVPIYGGQPYHVQEHALKRGVHVVVGTPGRVTDHLRRRSLDLGGARAIVLDEADEMLKMGFLEDVTAILDQAPEQRQVALFSATMPPAVKRIAERYLRDPETVRVEARDRAATTIRQRVLRLAHREKLDALCLLLELEPVDGVLVFARTRAGTVDLAERLESRGHRAEPLNGDMAQPLRERTVQRFREGGLGLLIATDVAARGLDVERISHVINYDIPHDAEAYIHRIGRTGRAGRSGEAILFATQRERNALRAIEHKIGQQLEEMEMPSVAAVNARRIARFKQAISETLEREDVSFFEGLLGEYVAESGAPPLAVAAALAQLGHARRPLLLEERVRLSPEERKKRKEQLLAGGMTRYRIEVGHEHGVKPGQIVGALANEGGLDGSDIGRIDIRTDHSLVDLPEGMPKEIFKALRKTRLCRQALRISLHAGSRLPKQRRKHKGPGKPKPKRKRGGPGGKFGGKFGGKGKRKGERKGEGKGKGKQQGKSPRE